jgi:hypothetical protein
LQQAGDVLFGGVTRRDLRSRYNNVICINIKLINICNGQPEAGWYAR